MDRTFSSSYRQVLSFLQFGRSKVVGSAGNRNMLYSADVDVMNSYPYSPRACEELRRQTILLGKHYRVPDVKCGNIRSWNLLTSPYIRNGQVVGYSQEKEIEHLTHLWNTQIVSGDEYHTAKKLLKHELSPIEFLKAKKECRFGLLRWDLKEVRNGSKQLRDGRMLSWVDACRMSPTKVDCIAFVDGRFCEFSAITIWTTKEGYSIAELPDYKTSIKQDILVYADEGNWFKVLKRMYIYCLEFEPSYVQVLEDFLNSSVGYLYSVVADLDVASSLEHPTSLERKERKYELDLLRNRYAKLRFPNAKVPLVPHLTDGKHFYSMLQRESKAFYDTLPFRDVFRL